MITEGGPTQKNGFSFTKAERILAPADFVRVRKNGRRFSTRSLTVFILPSESGVLRLGLSVSSRVGNSPARNRIKRLIREVFRLNKDFFPESSDILVSVKSTAWIKDLNGCREELSKVFTAGKRGL